MIRLPRCGEIGQWESLIASLTLEGDAQVVVPEGITPTVNGTEYTDCILTADSI